MASVVLLRLVSGETVSAAQGRVRKSRGVICAPVRVRTGWRIIGAGVMSAATPPEEFAAELRALYEAAGSPTYALLVHQAGQQRPPVKLTEQSLSDWLGGVSMPAKSAAVRFLAAYLGALATHQGHQVHGADWWAALHGRTQKVKQASRGGRPSTRVRSSGGAVKSRQLGQPIHECDPLVLEVHRAIELPGQDGARLPPYVPRAQDAVLREVVDTAVKGASRLAVLVGGSSTGKTRACWEASQDLPAPWRLWHPVDPTRPKAALADLVDVGRHTVVWLNDAHHYLLTADLELGEHVAARLNTLLTDPARSPVLALSIHRDLGASRVLTAKSAPELGR